MENNANRIAVARTQATDAMTHIDAIDSPRAPYRPMMDSEYDSITLPERNDFRSRLHARPLFRQHEFASGKIAARF
jgi:hypothetical protein